jgi:hypothetical protein
MAIIDRRYSSKQEGQRAGARWPGAPIPNAGGNGILVGEPGFGFEATGVRRGAGSNPCGVGLRGLYRAPRQKQS